MSVLLTRVLTNLIAFALAPVLHWMNLNGILDVGENAEFIGGIVGILVILWTLIRQHRETLTALITKGLSFREVKDQVKSGESVSIMTPTNQVPEVPTPTTGTGTMTTKLMPMIFIGLMLSLGCATSLKQKVTLGVQAADETMSKVQDTEISAYSSGIAPAYTEADHKKFHAALVKYFDAQAKAATLIQQWRSGEAAPTELLPALLVVKETITELSKVAPKAVQALVTFISTAVDGYINVINLFGGKLPEPAAFPLESRLWANSLLNN